jgi:hypothetical protein
VRKLAPKHQSRVNISTAKSSETLRHRPVARPAWIIDQDVIQE